MQSIVARDELTAEWSERGASEGKQFAALTEILHTGTFDLSTAEHKVVKQLGKRADLRDSMTPIELALTILGEATSADFHQTRDSQGMQELRRDAGEAGEVAGAARRDIENRAKHSVVSPENYKALRQGRQRELQSPLFEESDEGE